MGVGEIKYEYRPYREKKRESRDTDGMREDGERSSLGHTQKILAEEESKSAYTHEHARARTNTHTQFEADKKMHMMRGRKEWTCLHGSSSCSNFSSLASSGAVNIEMLVLC